MSDATNLKITDLPKVPRSWYLLGTKRDLRRDRFSKTILGRRLVAFRHEQEKFAVLEARCCHMGTDLGNGQAVDGTIECPFHNWRFDATGACVQIPCAASIPAFARQAAYPSTCLKDQIYFFNAPTATFPLPFYDGVDEKQLVASSSFSFKLECPWYMIAANGSDWQHFRAGHDRQLLEEPQVSQPHPLAYRTTYQLEIVGDSWSDRLTRAVAGRRVELQVTVWAGTIVLVKSTLERAQSFGMVSIIPAGAGESVAHVTVFARPSSLPLGGWLVDQMNLGLRKLLIHRFLATDAPRLKGTDICPMTLIDADRGLLNYLQWLQALPL